MLSLHLLQISLVCINTLTIQRVLTEDRWAGPMSAEHLRALTPLLYSHTYPPLRRVQSGPEYPAADRRRGVVTQTLNPPAPG